MRLNLNIRYAILEYYTMYCYVNKYPLSFFGMPCMGTSTVVMRTKKYKFINVNKTGGSACSGRWKGRIAINIYPTSLGSEGNFKGTVVVDKYSGLRCAPFDVESSCAFIQT